jgi:hypothetical protein
MRATETTKTNTRTRTNTAANTTLTASEKIDGAIIASAFAGTAIIGLWSLAALVGGMVAAGGPLGLVKGYFQALAGI